MDYYRDIEIYNIDIKKLYNEKEIEKNRLCDMYEEILIEHKPIIPKNISKIPLLPIIKGLAPCNKTNIETYIECYKYESIRIINHIRYAEIRCYECNADYLLICANCKTEICPTKAEKTSQVDINCVNHCLKNHNIIKVISESTCIFKCDNCGKFPEISSWMCKGSLYCSDCYNNNVFKMDLMEVKLIDLFYLTNFGNIADWIPIYYSSNPTTEEMHEYLRINDIKTIYPRTFEMDYLILYNINCDSPNHGKFAMMVYDDHGRMGFFNIKDMDTFEELKMEVEDIYINMFAKKKAMDMKRENRKKIEEQDEETKYMYKMEDMENHLYNPLSLFAYNRNIPLSCG